MSTEEPRASIQQIADACGVSAMTVSRALRGHPSVAPEKATTILEAAERLGYVPRPRAGRPHKSVREAKRPVVEVILSANFSSMNLFKMELLVPLEHELRQRGFSCQIHTASSAYTDFINLCQGLEHTHAVATAIVGYMPREQLRAVCDLAPNPLLLDHTGYDEEDRTYDAIAFNYVEAGRMAVEHLMKLGRKKIALLCGPAEHYFSRDIEMGYRQAMDNAGLPIDESRILHGEYNAAAARATFSQAVQQDLDCDAVFTNDEMGIGVLRALYEHRLDCPGQIAVLGCDGLPIAAQTVPSLSTMAVNYRQLGKIAAEALIRRSKGQHCDERLLPTLVERESTGAGHA